MSEVRSDPEALARLLDRTLPPNSSEVVGSTRDPLVSTAIQLARFVTPAPSPDFLRAGELRVLSAFDRQQTGKRIARLNRQIVFTRLAAAAALILVIFGSGLLSSASASLPGEPLYGVKRTIESVELSLAQGEDERADTLVRQAERRTDEALLLLRRSDFDAETVANALDLISQADAETSVGQSSPLNRRAEVVAFTLNVVLKGASETQLASANEVSTLVAELREIEAIIRRPAQPGAGGQPPAVSPSPETLPSGTPETAQFVPTASPTPTVEATAAVMPRPTETDEATNTPRPTRTPRPTNTAQATSTPRPTETDEATNTPRPTRTPRLTETDDATNTPRPTRTPRPTNTAQATSTPRPTHTPAATACPGSSCESAGRPGGQVDPAQPPGQSGGRNDNPPDPPGQGNPGGGNPPTDPGQGNPPSDPGGGNGNGNSNGGGNGGGNGNGNGGGRG